MGTAGEDWAHELGPIEGWWPQLAAMPSASAWEIVDAIHAAWIAGALGILDDAGSVLETDRRIGRFLIRVPEPSRPTYVYRMRNHEEDVRRWCWAPEWYFMEQDEDLMVFDPEHAAPLLEEAAAGCTKADYATSIVGHSIRDRLHAALFDGEGAMHAAFLETERVLSLATDPSAKWLSDYLTRVLTCRTPRRVTESDVRQRVFDFRCCTSNPHDEPLITRRERSFRAPIADESTLFVDVATGAMHAERA